MIGWANVQAGASTKQTNSWTRNAVYHRLHTQEELMQLMHPHCTRLSTKKLRKIALTGVAILADFYTSVLLIRAQIICCYYSCMDDKCNSIWLRQS